jgi:hypothetical protein
MLIITAITVLAAVDDPKALCADTKVRRIEYVFPARLIGCWLAEVEE